jgi:hypothetical protein
MNDKEGGRFVFSVNQEQMKVEGKYMDVNPSVD